VTDLPTPPLPEPAPVPVPAVPRWQWIAALAGLVALVWLLGPVLTPFVVAALLAWLGDPLVGRLERAGRPRTVGVLLVFALMALLLVIVLLFLVPMISDQVEHLIDWLPKLALWISGTAVPWLEARLHMDLAKYVDPMVIAGLLRQHWEQAGGIAATVLGGLSKSGLVLIEFMVKVLLVPVLTFYFLRDWPVIVARVRELLPRPIEPTVTGLAQQSDQMLGGFLRGQLSVMVGLGMIYAVGLWAVGLDLGLLIGMLAGLVSFVPYLGATFGVGAGLIAALVQFGDLNHLLLVAAVFTVGHLIESYVLMPWLVGDKIGMHPVAVIFSIMAGGHLFGFLGVLLALPVAAVGMVLLRYAHARYTQSALYGATAVPAMVAAVPVAPPESDAVVATPEPPRPA
jgi:predicted PurR-regulated permease PerM